MFAFSLRRHSQHRLARAESLLVTMKEPSTIAGNHRDALVKLCDSDIMAGDLAAVLTETLDTIESGDVKDIARLVPCLKTLCTSTELLQSNIQKSIRLLGHATFRNGYKSRQLAAF